MNYKILACLILGCISTSSWGNGPSEWVLETGKIITGTYVRHDGDILELADDKGALTNLSISQLTIEGARILYPTVSQDELEKPTSQSKGMYNSIQAREELFRRTKFCDMGRHKYARVYARGPGILLFETPDGSIFTWPTESVRHVKGLSAYLEKYVKQIPPEVNSERMKTMGPAIQQQEIAEIKQQAARTEAAANEALRLQYNNNPQNRTPIPPGYRFVNGTWVSP